jgi:hypothetical protein
LEALVAGLLPRFAPVDHVLMSVGDPLLVFGHIVR